MAICVVQEMPQGDQTIYETICRSCGIDWSPENWPEGMLTHVAGPGEGGGWWVITEWESREAFDRFRNEQLLPAAQNAGVTPTFAPKFFQVQREYHSPELTESTSQRRAA